MKARTFKAKSTEGFAWALGALAAGIIVMEIGKRVFGYKPHTP